MLTHQQVSSRWRWKQNYRRQAWAYFCSVRASHGPEVKCPHLSVNRPDLQSRSHLSHLLNEDSSPCLWLLKAKRSRVGCLASFTFCLPDMIRCCGEAIISCGTPQRHCLERNTYCGNASQMHIDEPVLKTLTILQQNCRHYFRNTSERRINRRRKRTISNYNTFIQNVWPVRNQCQQT